MSALSGLTNLKVALDGNFRVASRQFSSDGRSTLSWFGTGLPLERDAVVKVWK